MAVPTIETSKTSVPQTQSPLKLTDKDIQKMISNINATQIDALAKKLIAEVMSRLKIDVLPQQPIPGMTYPDTAGNLHQVYWDVYDTDSKLMKTLLPQVTKTLRESFTTTSFQENGVSFLWTNSTKAGLIDQIQDRFLAARVEEGKKKFMGNFDLSSMSFAIRLTLNMPRTTDSSSADTGKKPELYFSMDQFLNGAQVGNMSWPLSGIEEDAIHSII